MSSRIYPVSAQSLPFVRRRIAEAMAWCASDHAFNNRFRTPQLQPKSPLIIEERPPDGTYSYRHLETEDRIAIVDDVARRRAELLKLHAMEVVDSVPASPQRLLVTEIENSIWDGFAEMESEGFFDVYDIPAWDTWIDLREATNAREILCCVPLSLAKDAQAGIDVTCMSCIAWIDDVIGLIS